MNLKQILKSFALLLVILANSGSNALFAKSFYFSDHSAKISTSKTPFESIPFQFQPLLDDQNEEDEIFCNYHNLGGFSLGHLCIQVLTIASKRSSDSGTFKRHLWRFNNNFRL